LLLRLLNCALVGEKKNFDNVKKYLFFLAWANINNVDSLEYQRVNGRIIIRVKKILKEWGVKIRKSFSLGRRRIQGREDEKRIMNIRIT